jgi:hypothetical protein
MEKELSKDMTDKKTEFYTAGCTSYSYTYNINTQKMSNIAYKKTEGR